MRKSKKGLRRRVILAVVLGVLALALVAVIVWKKSRMQEKEPEFSGTAKTYLNLQTDGWLTVCVWQLDGGPVSCGLLPGKYRYWSDADTRDGLEMGLRAGVTPEEMKRILATYDVPKDRILVVSWTNPASSTFYCPLGERLEEIREMLLKDK